MTTRTRPADIDAWIKIDPNAQPEPGYDEYVKAAIEEGRAELDAGLGIPLEQVRKELGLE